MKRILLFASVVIVFVALTNIFSPGDTTQTDPWTPRPGEAAAAVPGNAPYTMIAWNDLGMHCINPRFAEIGVLPPFNNIRAIVIRRGKEPQLVTSGVTVSYGFAWNKTVKGKTDFWQHAEKLFGVKLAEGVGLTGNGLSGRMKPTKDYFEATGIPILPYNDDKTWNPYQWATVMARDTKGAVLSTASFVVPVSDEMRCDKCHSTGGVAAKGINTGTVDGNILALHDKRQNTKLYASRPVLCANCHADAALGKPGTAGAASLSLAMHRKHSTLTNMPACYDCHPGPKTSCNRSAIEDMGPKGASPNCAKCHGNLKQVADGLIKGRQPWLDEPTCAQCHGKEYDTKGVLYREAKGHGGVYCVACHNSPHAWWPSKRPDDNSLPMNLQGNSHAIGYKSCYVCHTNGRRGDKPPHNGEGDD